MLTTTTSLAGKTSCGGTGEDRQGARDRQGRRGLWRPQPGPDRLLPNQVGGALVPSRRARVRRRLQRARAVWQARVADQRGSQITDNLGLVVIGIVAIVAIGGLISGLDKTVFSWITQQLGLS